MTFFYNLNKKLDAIRDLPSTTHGQLNERDMSRAAKGYEKYGKEGMEALAKAGRDGKSLDPVRKKYDKYDNTEVDEGLGDMARRVGGMVKKVAGKALNTLGHGDDADVMRDLQRKMGVPQTGMKPGDEPNPKQVKEKMNPAKAKSFAALAEPKDKITFADKIAGAKKEVDEMLGDVAAEAMKQALGGGKGRNAEMDEASTDNAFTAHKRPRVEKPAVGTVTRGSKHDVEEIPGGRRVTRRVDPSGISVGADDDTPAGGEKRGRGRPKGPEKAPERVTGGATKHKGGRKTNEGSDYGQAQQIYDDLADIRAAAKQAQRGGEFPQGFASRLESVLYAAMTLIKNQQASGAQVSEEELDEKAVSKKQQRFMGMVHAAKKGEKPASKEVAKAAKGMGKKDAEDFAATKHKGLPEKAKESSDSRDTRAEKAGKKVTKDIEYDEKAKDGDHGKKRGPQDAKAEKAGKKVAKDIEHDEKVDETSDSKKSGGFKFGGGIYDSMNRDLENMIAESMARLDESMSINMSMNNDEHGGPSKSLTVTATDEDAMKLSQLLKSAGLGGGDEGYGGGGYKPACGCGTPDCSCGEEKMDEVSMNKPDYPTDTETSSDALQYAGGLNKPKSTGQSTVPVLASQDDRQESYAAEEEDAIKRMMEMAGIEFTEEMLEEGWREKLGAAGLAGAMALGSLGAGAAQAAPQQGLGTPTAATQQQTQDIWMPAYKRALSLSSATKSPELKQEIDKLQQFYQEQSGRIGLSGKLSKNMEPKAAQDQKQLDLKYKDGLEKLMQKYGGVKEEQVMAEEDDLARMMEMAGVKKKEVDEEKTDEGNKFAFNVIKAKEAGKKEADLDGDGDMEKVRESIFDLTNQWRAYKG
jgi:Protein of unknwon function (DUF3008)